MAESTLMTTDDVAPRDRAPQWCEWVFSHFGGLRSDLYGDTVFDGHIAASHAGDVILTRLEANRHRVLRTPSMARTSETAYLKIVAPWQGSATVQQQGREACARDGAWVIYDTTGAYEIENPERVDHLIVMVPKEGITERGLRFDGVMARRLGTSGISRVALETMRNTYQELPNMSAAAAQGAGELIKQLVRLSLQELSGVETAVTQREALRERIRIYVHQHLRDPSLGADSVASALAVSRRQLYRACAGADFSLEQYIIGKRLENARADLAKPRDTRTIAAVAASWGFKDQTHFARRFRAAYGELPGQWRRRS